MKGIREYAAVLTAIVAGIVSVEILWFATNMEIIHVLAWACFISMGVLVGCGLFMEDEPEQEEEQTQTSEFVDCDGLSVLIQRSRRS